MHISSIDKSFGLKLQVIKHLPLKHLQTKDELTLQSHFAVGHRFALKHVQRFRKYAVETSRHLLVSLLIIGIYSIESHQQKEDINFNAMQHQ